VHTSSIYVEYEDGSPARACSVALGFGLLGGMTRTFYTNRSGVAEVEHAHFGRAWVFVNGREYHSFTAPGETTVVL
jgi:hypothetical protein